MTKKGGLRVDVYEDGEFEMFAREPGEQDVRLVRGQINVAAFRTLRETGAPIASLDESALGSIENVSGEAFGGRSVPDGILSTDVAFRAALSCWLWGDLVNAKLSDEEPAATSRAPRRGRAPSMRRGRHH